MSTNPGVTVVYIFVLSNTLVGFRFQNLFIYSNLPINNIDSNSDYFIFQNKPGTVHNVMRQRFPGHCFQ